MIYPATIGIIIITFIFLDIKIRRTTYVMPWSSPLIEMNAILLLAIILIALMWIISYVFFRGTNWMPIYKVETIITQIAP